MDRVTTNCCGRRARRKTHLRVLETFAVQDDFRDERVIRDHHRHRAEARLVRKMARRYERAIRCFPQHDANVFLLPPVEDRIVSYSPEGNVLSCCFLVHRAMW